jgi:RimJ/RimL family protein N-acetyltransferase
LTLDPALISFRRLTMEDLPLMHRWLNTDHVAQWYDVGGVHYPAVEQVEARYAPAIRGEMPTDQYVILYGDLPIGPIQTYRIGDHPAYAQAVQLDGGAWGVDIAIGEVDYVHRGLGSYILRRFLRDIVFALPNVTSCVIGPDPTNSIAIRAYEKAGFTYLKTVTVPGDLPSEQEYLMVISREDVIDISSDSSSRPRTRPLL